MRLATLYGTALTAALALVSVSPALAAAPARAQGRTPLTDAQFSASLGKETHIMRPKGFRYRDRQGRLRPDTPNGPLSYHGGTLVMHMKTYLVFWGWHGVDGVWTTEQNFLRDVGGSSWLQNDAQYTDATGKAIANPPHQLAGVWLDQTDPLPYDPSNAMFGQEALNAQAHFLGHYDPNAVYVIATPSGDQDAGNGFGTQFCAYHSAIDAGQGYLPYVNQPYVTDAGQSCYAYALGGALDGVSITLGHELAETQTDPLGNGYYAPDSQQGVIDEIGDLCVNQNLESLYLLSQPFAVQSLYSLGGAYCSDYAYSKFSDFAISGRGTLWALGTDKTSGGHTLYSLSPPGYARNFYATFGFGTNVAADNNYPYLVSSTGALYYYSAYNGMNLISAPPATAVSPGADGALWILGTDNTNNGHTVYEIGGSLGYQSWTPIGGATGKRLIALSGTAMVVDGSKHVREYNPYTLGWDTISSESAVDLATNTAQTNIYMLGLPKAGPQFTLFTYTPQSPSGPWTSTGYSGSRAGEDSNGYPWVLASTHYIWQYDPNCNCMHPF